MPDANAPAFNVSLKHAALTNLVQNVTAAKEAQKYITKRKKQTVTRIMGRVNATRKEFYDKFKDWVKPPGLEKKLVFYRFFNVFNIDKEVAYNKLLANKDQAVKNEQEVTEKISARMLHLCKNSYEVAFMKLRMWSRMNKRDDEITNLQDRLETDINEIESKRANDLKDLENKKNHEKKLIDVANRKDNLLKRLIDQRCSSLSNSLQILKARANNIFNMKKNAVCKILDINAYTTKEAYDKLKFHRQVDTFKEYKLKATRDRLAFVMLNTSLGNL